MTDRRAIAVVLARAGSKGVPGKNVALVAGKPCICWTLEHALASTSVGRVVVTTDDPRAAQEARDRGVEVVARPPLLATDTATVDDAVRHAVAQAAPEHGPRDVCVILYANVPVRPPDLTDRAVELLLRTGADSVQSYARVGKHHPWWTVRVGEADGTLAPWEGDVLYHDTYRRQDLPAAHIPDGGVVAVTMGALFGRVEGVRPGPHAFLGADRRGVVNPDGAVIDIDSPIDLIVADTILRRGSDAACNARFARVDQSTAAIEPEPACARGRRAS